MSESIKYAVNYVNVCRQRLQEGLNNKHIVFIQMLWYYLIYTVTRVTYLFNKDSILCNGQILIS